MGTRTMIGEAQGILVQHYGLHPNGAFEFRRRYSLQHNIKLRSLAEALVETGQLPAQYGSDELRRLTRWPSVHSIGENDLPRPTGVYGSTRSQRVSANRPARVSSMRSDDVPDLIQDGHTVVAVPVRAC
ncbi:MAG TPA: ANTAR domain-containing protein [Jiangellaceae bacterium]|nr:ANTAR domain-containing protein [Jiangellaceae bacterium]